jgi:arylsulfatase A-like enzyme
MPPEKLTRREFLKTLSILSLLPLKLSSVTRNRPHFQHSTNQDLPNIFILVFDTLSAKHMSLYGYPRNTTPNMSRFADRAVVFHRHYAGGNFTTSGTASLLTGTYPWSHRALHLHGRVLNKYEDRNIFNFFADQFHSFAYTHNPLVAILLHEFRGQINHLTKISDLCLFSDTISESLFNQDFNTAYESELVALRNGNDPSSSLLLSIFDQIRRAYQTNLIDKAYRNTFPRGVPNLFDEQLPSFMFFTLEKSIDWMISQLQMAPAPFLGYVHLLPPHGEYTTRRDFVDIFVDGWKPAAKPEHVFSEGRPEDFLITQRRYYDEYLAYVDAEFGRLVGALDQSGVLDNTFFILTSDHGEMFERGILAHITPTLFEPIIRIPLLISRPGLRTRQDVYSPTSCVDILPTLLHVTGQKVPPWCEGQILPFSAGKVPGADRAIYAVEAKENNKIGPLKKATIAMIKGEYKLVHYLGYENYHDNYELYNLGEDPEELENLDPSGSAMATHLQEELISKIKEINDQRAR